MVLGEKVDVDELFGLGFSQIETKQTTTNQFEVQCEKIQLYCARVHFLPCCVIRYWVRRSKVRLGSGHSRIELDRRILE